MAVDAQEPSLILASIRFEIPKEVATWLPMILAVVVGLGVDRLLRWSGAGDARRVRSLWATGLVAVVVLVAALPWRDRPIDTLHVGEHRLSESLAISLHWSEWGYWDGYPDTRRLVDDDQEAMLDYLRTEQAAGRIGPTTEVLHIAADFRQLTATPIGALTGILETTLAPGVAVSIHSVGGRLHPLDELWSLISSSTGRPRYVVIEPAGLPPGISDRLIPYGYQAVFQDHRAVVLADVGGAGALR
jgi:hypothetical protein